MAAIMSPAPPLSRKGEEYIKRILGQQTPLELDSTGSDDAGSDSARDALLRADALWNLGKPASHVKGAVEKCREMDSFNEYPGNKAFASGIEALADSNLELAYANYSQACRLEKGTLAVFLAERAVNIGFWLACNGKMLQAADCAVQSIGPEALPETPFLAGVLAFAQHMNGQSETAEIVAMDAVQRGYKDPWTLHAVAHCMHSLGRSKECASWILDHRALVSASNPSPFMKGHFEFHLALCLIDMEDSTSLEELIVNGPLWASMDESDQGDFWNAVGLLGVLWKAELRGITSSFSSVVRSCEEKALAMVRDANPAISPVFSLCILRSKIRHEPDSFIEWCESLESEIDNQVLAAVARAVRITYTSKSDLRDSDRWLEAAQILSPVANRLAELGASPEQREVIEEFVGIVASQTRGSGLIDLEVWGQRNRRPNVPFYDRCIGSASSDTK